MSTMKIGAAVSIAVSVALALAATGCSGGSGDSAPSSAAGPAWIATRWHRSFDDGVDFTTEVWNLKPDGTGTLRSATVRP